MAHVDALSRNPHEDMIEDRMVYTLKAEEPFPTAKELKHSYKAISNDQMEKELVRRKDFVLYDGK